jgi:uncharacterized protein YegP (UPF0339 family)
MTVIEIFRAKNKEFCFRLMGKNYKEIYRASETYKRKATMKKSIVAYCPVVFPVVDLTLLAKGSLKKTKKR